MLTAKAEIIVDDEITLKRFAHNIDKIRYKMILANHDHLLPWMPWADTYHKFEDMLNFIEDQIKDFDAGKQFGYDIFYHEKPVGTIDIHAVSEENFHCELGYWLDQDYAGKGIMTRVASVLANYAMQELDMHRVILKVASENQASISVAERAGFKREALLRDEQYLSGRFYDTIIYTKIKGETWKE